MTKAPYAIVLVVLFAVTALTAACSSDGPAEHAARFPAVAEPNSDDGDLPTARDLGPKDKNAEVMAPPFSTDVFPCSDCHDPEDPEDVDPEPRALEDPHSPIALDHGSDDGWCYQCHNPLDRDRLHLASGRPVDFEESYKLCGQCHGEKLRDWQVGVHGKRTGYWNGPKEYLLCVHCHSPHKPRFGPLRPLPPPVRPSEIRE